jgi:hypothetical protein
MQSLKKGSRAVTLFFYQKVLAIFQHLKNNASRVDFRAFTIS